MKRFEQYADDHAWSDYGNLSYEDCNDGLTSNDWLEWFKNYDLSQTLAIIHFTKFRY